MFTLCRLFNKTALHDNYANTKSEKQQQTELLALGCLLYWLYFELVFNLFANCRGPVLQRTSRQHRRSTVRSQQRVLKTTLHIWRNFKNVAPYETSLQFLLVLVPGTSWIRIYYFIFSFSWRLWRLHFLRVSLQHLLTLFYAGYFTCGFKPEASNTLRSKLKILFNLW